MAKRRLESLKRRLERDDMLKIKYTQEMQRVLDKGYAEVVPEEERDSSNRVWYIPHHPNSNKPDKVRIVYDCAAKSKGVSLNEKLMKGPDLVNRLVGVLLRFRKERIAIVSDIEGMFHQVRCAPEDRDCLRFLWWPQGDLSKECAAFALLETAKQFGKNYGVVVVEIVKKSFYVDDCLITVADENKGIRLIKDLQNLLACGRFQLNKWISTSPAVIQTINVEDRAQVMSKLELGDVASERVLGMRWNVQSDDFQFVTNLRISHQRVEICFLSPTLCLILWDFYPLSYLKQGCCLESCFMVRLNGTNLYPQSMPCIGRGGRRVCAV